MPSSEKAKVAVLIAIAAFIVFHAYLTFLVYPLQAERTSLTQGMAKSHDNIDAESAELRRLRTAEEEDKANEPLDRLVERLVNTIPVNPIITCPDLLKRSFAGTGTSKTKTSLTVLLPFKILPGYLTHIWEVRSEKVRAFQLGKEVAEFETKNPLVQIGEFTLSADPNDTASEHAELSIQIPVKP